MPDPPGSKPNRSAVGRALLRATRTATACFTIWSYSLLAPLGALGFGVLAFAWRKDPIERTRRLQRLMAGAYGLFHDWMRWVRVVDFDHREGIERLPDGPCVVVANHPTLIDITATTAMLGGACTIAKPEFFRRRLLRGMLRSSGHIEGVGARMDQERTRVLIASAVEMLSLGFRLVVFPEGTRSARGQLRPFGRTSFEIACRAGVPVVALSIESDPPYLHKEGSIYRPPLETSDLRIRLLDIFRPETFGGDSRALRREVESRYREALEGAQRPGLPRPDATAPGRSQTALPGTGGVVGPVPPPATMVDLRGAERQFGVPRATSGDYNPGGKDLPHD